MKRDDSPLKITPHKAPPLSIEEALALDLNALVDQSQAPYEALGDISLRLKELLIVCKKQLAATLQGEPQPPDTMSATTLRETILALDQRLTEATRKRTLLLARARRTHNPPQISNLFNHATTSHEAFSRLEEKIDQIERDQAHGDE